jgi:hypothetical protein
MYIKSEKEVQAMKGKWRKGNGKRKRDKVKAESNDLNAEEWKLDDVLTKGEAVPQRSAPLAPTFFKLLLGSDQTTDWKDFNQTVSMASSLASLVII